MAAAPPSTALALSGDAVLAWLRTHAPSVCPPATPTSLRILKFNHGQSNPTYLLELASGSSTRKLVLRKQPPGTLLRGAHAVDREYRVQKAIANHGVPVATMIGLETSPEVLGSMFYVMSFADGVVHLDPQLPSTTPEQRQGIYNALADTLAAIHEVNPTDAGLGNFGKPHAYAERQVAVWKRQYAADWAKSPLPEMVKLTAWLEDNVPRASKSHALAGRPAVIHGDYRLDNVVFDGATPKAVLDWELSTLGDPLADLAYLCLTLYHAPPAAAPTPGKRVNPPAGAPDETQLVQHYCSRRGVPPPSPNVWACYLALGCYRMAAILAGLHARALRGNASASNATKVGAAAKGFAAYGLSLVEMTPSSDGHHAFARPLPAPRPHKRTTRQWYQSEKSASIMERLESFMDEHVYPAEAVLIAEQEARRGSDRWMPHAKIEELKALAKKAKLWNLFLPSDTRELIAPSIRAEVDCGPGLTNMEYAPLSEIMGACSFASEVFNCSAPDTGNMETLARYGSIEQQEKYLKPLLAGEMRSCFAMTEPAVASSDATNMQAEVVHDAKTGEMVLRGRKWWTTGAPDPRCRVCIFMGRDADADGRPGHRRHSMVLVPLPHSGVRMLRPLTVFGYDDAPHGHAELEFENVRVPATNVLLGVGRGFEIAQGRLGPGRLHHCMRAIGLGERALAMAIVRGSTRKAFGRPLAVLSADKIAEARVQLDTARMAVLSAAAELDARGNKDAKASLAIAKVVAPRAALFAIDSAIQIFGGAGVSQDALLASFYAGMRTLRLADGPDEVHLSTIAKVEMKKWRSRL